MSTDTGEMAPPRPMPAPPASPVFYPAICYEDAPAAIVWLERAFGFRPRMVAPGEGGRINHAELTLGDAVLMIGSADAARGALGRRALPGSSQSLSMYVPDIAAHYRRAVAAGAEVTDPLSDKHYGGSGYGARDLEGNDWWFGSSVPGAWWEE